MKMHLFIYFLMLPLECDKEFIPASPTPSLFAVMWWKSEQGPLTAIIPPAVVLLSFTLSLCHVLHLSLSLSLTLTPLPFQHLLMFCLLCHIYLQVGGALAGRSGKNAECIQIRNGRSSCPYEMVWCSHAHARLKKNKQTMYCTTMYW